MYLRETLILRFPNYIVGELLAAPAGRHKCRPLLSETEVYNYETQNT